MRRIYQRNAGCGGVDGTVAAAVISRGTLRVPHRPAEAEMVTLWCGVQLSVGFERSLSR